MISICAVGRQILSMIIYSLFSTSSRDFAPYVIYLSIFINHLIFLVLAMIFGLMTYSSIKNKTALKTTNEVNMFVSTFLFLEILFIYKTVFNYYKIDFPVNFLFNFIVNCFDFQWFFLLCAFALSKSTSTFFSRQKTGVISLAITIFITLFVRIIKYLLISKLGWETDSLLLWFMHYFVFGNLVFLTFCFINTSFLQRFLSFLSFLIVIFFQTELIHGGCLNVLDAFNFLHYDLYHTMILLFLCVIATMISSFVGNKMLVCKTVRKTN